MTAPFAPRTLQATTAPRERPEALRKRRAALAVALASALLTFGVQAGVTFYAGRLGAEDVERVAKFYQAAFGLQEVNRIKVPSGTEVFLNFGDTVDSAKSSSATRVVIMHRDSDSVAATDQVPHLMLIVTDMAATLAAIKAAGGTVEGEPFRIPSSPMLLGFAADPAGNRIELLQPPRP